MGSLGIWGGLNGLLFPWIPALLLWAIARRPLQGSFRELIAGWGFACALFMVIQSVPARSEWMVGGWDPGIYTNEALKLVRTGSLHSEVHPFAQALGDDALAPEIRAFDVYVELFPGVPIEPHTGSVTPAFPRMAVAFFASVGRWLGPEGVLKAPLIFAALLLFLFMTWAVWADESPYHAWAVLILTVGQPLFIHYAITPSSEMIELLLLTTCLGGFWLGASSRQGWFLVAILAMTLAANRTSFLLFGSLGLWVMALWDWKQVDRRQMLIRHGGIAVALWVGHFILGNVTPVAIYKLSHILPRIYKASLMLMGGALIVDVLSFWPAIQGWGVRVAKRGGPGVLPAFWLILLSIAIGGRIWEVELARNFRVWVAYAGVLGVAAAAAGSVGPALRRSSAAGVLLLFLGLALTMVLWQKHAAELYPWALKRFLPWGIPLVALGASFFCIDWARRVGRDWLVLGLALILVAPVGRVVLQAWRAGEYVGVNQSLSEVTGRVGANAWVVCDHFQWATPLYLAFGVSALDGHRLLENAEMPEAKKFWSRLAALQRKGQVIYFLSSNDTAVDPWVLTPGRHRLIWHSDPLRFREIHQHATNRDFPVRTLTHEFTLYEWCP